MEKKRAESASEGESSKSKSNSERLLQDLRKKNSEMVIFAKFTPFILGMVGGPIIEPDPLGAYIDQRIVVLNQYIKMGRKAEGMVVDAKHKSPIADLVLAIEDEIKMLTELYKDFLLQTWVLKESREPVLRDYVRMLERTETFYKKGPIIGAAVAVGSIASSFRLYAHLGNVMKDCLHQDLDKHVYKKWINHYISPRVQALAGQIEALIEDLFLQSTLTNATFKKFYSESLSQELKLLYSQVVQKNTVSPMRNAFDEGYAFDICFEFNKTCIKNDANDAFLKRVTKLKDNHLYTIHDKFFLEQRDIMLWSGDKFKKFIDDGVDHQGIEETMKKIDNAVVGLDPYFLSKHLKGKHEDEIKVKTKLKFRDGCRNFFQALKKEHQGFRIHVISDVLSEHQIRSAIPKGAFPHNIYIHSNALNFVDGTATGLFDQKITSLGDKLKTFKSLTCDGMVKQLSVFIGSSIDDFSCLMEANIGIVVELDSMFEGRAKHMGVTFVPLYESLVKKQAVDIQEGELSNLDDFRDLTVVWKPQLGILYTVSSWTEVQAFLVGV